MFHIVKYILEGLAVSFVAYYLTGKKTELFEIMLLGVAASITFMIIDMFAPNVAPGLRQGSGFGIGYGMVGGGSRPKRWYDPTVEGFESQEQYDDFKQNLGNPYKLREGPYSAGILQAGYNENVRPYNSYGDPHVSDPSIWNKDLFDAYEQNNKHPQQGGDGAPIEPAPASAAAPAPAQAMQNNEKKPNSFLVDDADYRESGVLHSGDLVMLSNNGNSIQRGTVDSQIVFDKPLPKMGSNLSKLRIVLAKKHSIAKQVPIKYGDEVNILHNAYFNNKNETRFIKYGERLQSHQEGPLFRVFKIVDPVDPKRTGNVESGKEVLLLRGDNQGDNIYLKLEDDKTVSSAATKSTATKFIIDVVRVFELHNKNLCVCPNEILYP
jgi:hypothetical protein